MLAHAFLAVTARAQRPGRKPPAPPETGIHGAEPGKRGAAACGQRLAPPRTYSPPLLITGSNGDELIPLTTGEVRRLFSQHVSITRPYAYHERWSRWRRRHQARAQRCHYQRRLMKHRLLPQS